MEILTIILSSAFVSGFVSLSIGHYLDHKKYIKDKKVNFYLEYMDKVDSLFEMPEDIRLLDKKMIDASSELHKLNWKIRLLTKNQKIIDYSEKIVRTYDKFTDEDFKLKAQEDIKIAHSAIEEINSYRDKLIGEANKEINSFF